MTAAEALHSRQEFEFGHYAGIRWPDGGAYEVLVGGRTVAFEFPGRPTVFNEAHPAVELVRSAMEAVPGQLVAVA